MPGGHPPQSMQRGPGVRMTPPHDAQRFCQSITAAKRFRKGLVNPNSSCCFVASKPQKASWCGLSVGIVPWAVGIHKHAVFLLEGSYLTTPALLGQLFLSFTQLLKKLKLSQNQSLTLSSWSLTPPEHPEIEELFCSDTTMLNAGHYQQRIPGLA